MDTVVTLVLLCAVIFLTLQYFKVAQMNYAWQEKYEALKLELKFKDDLFRTLQHQPKPVKGKIPKTWRAALGFPTGYIPTKDEVNSAYRKMAKVAHPDMGGSVAAMIALNLAKDTAMEVAR